MQWAECLLRYCRRLGCGLVFVITCANWCRSQKELANEEKTKSDDSKDLIKASDTSRCDKKENTVLSFTWLNPITWYGSTSNELILTEKEDLDKAIFAFSINSQELAEAAKVPLVERCTLTTQYGKEYYTTSYIPNCRSYTGFTVVANNGKEVGYELKTDFDDNFNLVKVQIKTADPGSMIEMRKTIGLLEN